MKLVYEKHQRDYTVLITSLIMEFFFGKKIKKQFPFTPHPMYILVKNSALSHIISESDYKSWANSWLKKNNIASFKKHKKMVDNLFVGYKKILKKQHHQDLEADLNLFHQYFVDFMPIVLMMTYVPMYGENVNKKLLALLLKARKQYEDIHKIGIPAQIKLLRKIEKKYGLDRDVLQYLTISEFRNFLQNKKIPTDIKKRRYFFLYEHSIKGEKILTKKQASAKLKIVDPKVDKLITKIKGLVAYPGMVQGRVKIIKLVKDSNKLKPGEILVASMTDPRYISAMKRAAAFVTDEGGITCHAAIVAREMKKPCVIGTRIATKVLKDGDKVEVDASVGVVRKL